VPVHDYVASERPTTAQVNAWVRDQVITIDTTANLTAMGTVTTGRYAFDTTLNLLVRYNGSAWVPGNIPVFTTATLPASPATNTVVFNSTRLSLERYTGTVWTPISYSAMTAAARAALASPLDGQQVYENDTFQWMFYVSAAAKWYPIPAGIVATAAPDAKAGTLYLNTNRMRAFMHDGTAFRSLGIYSTTSGARPGTPTDGDPIWETDTDRLLFYDGGNTRWAIPGYSFTSGARPFAFPGAMGYETDSLSWKGCTGGTTWTAIGGGNLGLYGDGSDGAVAFDGTNTYASFASKAGSVYTLIRDVYATTVAVTGSATVTTAGFRIFATTSITVNVTAGINANGGSASGQTAGAAAATTGVTGGGGAGGQGGNSASAGSNGGNVITAGGGAGGAGGTGNGGANAAGTAGTSTVLTAAEGGLKQFNYPLAMTGRTPSASQIKGGAGGSGGGGGSTSYGGGGGGGAGVVLIAAPLVTGTGTVNATGGNGGTGGNQNGGGGGGGGGGYVFIMTAAALGGSLSVNVAAGSGGAKNGTGVVGTAGSAGNSNTLILA